MNDQQLIARLERLCHNDFDFFTHIPWSDAEIQAVVTILNDNLVDIMDPEGPRHCFVIQALFHYVTSTGGPNPSNPYTDVPMSPQLKRRIFNFYLHYLKNKTSSSRTLRESRDFRLLRRFSMLMKHQTELKQTYQTRFFALLGDARLNEEERRRQINELRVVFQEMETLLLTRPENLSTLQALNYHLERVVS